VVAAARAALGQGNEAVVNTGYQWVTTENLETEEIQRILY
jgi:ribose transport system substrate-binding protein